MGPNGRPVVHGDLKAANVLLAAGGMLDPCPYTPKIADFGLSRVRGATSSASRSFSGGGGGTSSGTLAWMAPELLAGSRATEATGA